MNLPNTPRSKFVDVGEMAIKLGVTRRGKHMTELGVLCRGQGYLLQKPAPVRTGEIFNSEHGTLPSEALKYCQLDVEAPMILYRMYLPKKVLTGRLKRNENIAVETAVDIMPSRAESLYAIAQGGIFQTSGICKELGNLKLREEQVVVKVEKVFDGNGIIHYPATAEARTSCSCGYGSHTKIRDSCDFYLYRQFGQPSYLILSLESRQATRISADSSKKKRKYPSHRAQPKCSICNKTTCTVGVRNKKMCPQFVAELNDEQH